MKVVVLGSNGQLGADVVDVFSAAGHQVQALTHADIEVADADSVGRALAETAADVIINTAAFHNVEQCEADPSRAFAVNSIGARNLALAANHLGAKLVHVSTDYVFDGSLKRPATETDCPLPVNVYGNSKLSGEAFIRTVADRGFVVRVGAIFGRHPCRAKGGNNFVTTMLRLARERPEVRVLDCEIVAPTYTLDISRQLEILCRTDAYGLCHIAAQGECSWHAFARRIFDLTGAEVKLSVASADEFPAKIRRPTYSVLTNAALRAIDSDIMPSWEDGLSRYLQALGLIR